MSKRKWLFRITLCLALGVVTTVGVAWGLAWANARRTVTYAYSGAVRAGDRAWWTHESWFFGGGEARWLDMRSNTTAESDEALTQWVNNQIQRDDERRRLHELPSGPPAWGTISTEHVIAEIQHGRDFAYGLPFLALSMSDRGHESPGGGVICRLHGGWYLRFIKWEGWDRMFIALPYTPVWPGLAANIVFYTAIWFVVIFAPGCVKRWNRKRRGLCPMCKYILRGNPVGVTGCAECGWGREEFTAESPRARREDSSAGEEQQA